MKDSKLMIGQLLCVALILSLFFYNLIHNGMAVDDCAQRALSSLFMLFIISIPVVFVTYFFRLKYTLLTTFFISLLTYLPCFFCSYLLIVAPGISIWLGLFLFLLTGTIFSYLLSKLFRKRRA